MLYNRSKLTRALCLLLCGILLALTVSCDKRVAPTFTELDFSEIDASTCKESETPTDYVKLSVSIKADEDAEPTILPDIIIRLYPDVAPETVENFKKLVSEKFYDGLTFHRICKGFMIQGGCPNGDGTGDAGQDIKGEFTSNGFENNLKHIRGVVSMARTPGLPDSASCQFFIMHKASTSLNGDYAAFGYVVSGMDSVDEIASVPVQKNSGDELSDPLVIVTIESARFVQP